LEGWTSFFTFSTIEFSQSGGYITIIGTFKTSTIDVLHKVISENDEGIFSWFEGTTKSKKQMDEATMCTPLDTSANELNMVKFFCGL
jgi:hypothetical protein